MTMQYMHLLQQTLQVELRELKRDFLDRQIDPDLAKL